MNNNTRGNKKSIGTTILILAVGLAYLAMKPKLEKWLGTELPGGPDRNVVQNDKFDQQEESNTTEKSGNRTQAPPAATAGSKSQESDVLTKVGRDYHSKAGLIYGSGSEHRRDHVLRHAKDDMSKPVHGVFDDKDQVFALVDEAYEKVKNGSKDVKTSKQGSRTAYTINMRRRIGYKGGQSGKRKSHPETKSLKLILVEGNHVITAYPY